LTLFPANMDLFGGKMRKAKVKDEKKYISILIAPHYTHKARVFKFSVLFPRILAVPLVLLIVLALLTGLALYSNSQNSNLKKSVDALKTQNSLQNESIRQKELEIMNLKENEQQKSKDIKNLMDKYKEMADNYLRERTGEEKTSRSGKTSSSRSLKNDISDIKALISDLKNISTSSNLTVDLSGTEENFKTFLDSIPTKWPAHGNISSRFGYREHPVWGSERFHDGIDIAADYGDDIYAAAGGKVTHAGNLPGYGKTIIIRHEHGITTMYGHASKLLLEEGEKVRKGDTIARVGNSGTSTGPHLHFRIELNGSPVNPLDYLE